MQIRCSQCHKPFGLGKEAVLAALEMITQENLTHYDTACPHCRRINRVSLRDLKRAAPYWGRPKPQEDIPS
jgi:phage FluMu protein Com